MEYTVLRYWRSDLLKGTEPYLIFGSTMEDREEKFRLGLQYLIRHLSPDIELEPDEHSYNLESDATMVIALSKTDGVIGMGRLVEVKRWNKFFGYIEDVVVLPEFRCRGVATEIVNRLIWISKKSKHYKTLLSCSDDAAPFYERLRFEKKSLTMRLDHVNI